jgi:hypothetical protein
MSSKFLAGAVALATTTAVLVAAGPASAQSWQYFGNATAGAPDFAAGAYGYHYYGYYPGYAYPPGYAFTPSYSYPPGRLLHRNTCCTFHQPALEQGRNGTVDPNGPTRAQTLRTGTNAADDHGSCATEQEATLGPFPIVAQRKPRLE